MDISREDFEFVIESLREQVRRDIVYGDSLLGLLGVDGFYCYDNSLVVNGLLRLLRLFSPIDENGHCEISHYCFECNFGKIGEEYESPGEFYDRLKRENGER